ncbi:MAG: hypothetical protein D4R64_08505 [Porphyromonadaceae bacterium]|nr:MAG: hypothetical protein D4R64_08505 [Porphyromonadaceae bacterium]
MNTIINKLSRSFEGIALSLICILLLIPSPLCSQQNIGRQTILQFDPNHKILRPDAELLKVSTHMILGGKSQAFLGGVGGISFDQIAQPADGLNIRQMTLTYNPELPDRQRIELIVNGNDIKVGMPDWMIIPIAKYADSPHYSCFTLFGQLKDTAAMRVVTENEGRVMNYHPDFDNTLMGIRLAYMDMLIGYPFTDDLPKNSMNQYILGNGENEPDLNANQNGLYRLSRYLQSIEDKYQDKFRSYVVSDFNQKIRFDFKNDSLSISGFPFFYCWKYKQDDPKYDINKVANELKREYQTKSDSRDWLINRLIALADKYGTGFTIYESGTFVDLVNISQNQERKTFLEKYSTESLYEMAISAETLMDANSINYMKDYSIEFSVRPELFEAANPAVWKATVATMCYSAFFRYLKAQFPDKWSTFIRQVQNIDPEPRVETPTVMYDPKNKNVEEAISRIL